MQPGGARAPRNTGGADLTALRRQEEAGSLLMAARNALRKGERQAAIRLIKEVFAVVPGDVGALDLLGDIYLEEGETEKALKLYERAFQMHPTHAPFEEKLAICRLDLAEIHSDQETKKALLEAGDLSALKADTGLATRAAALSLLVPGMGQFLNDEVDKAWAHLAGAVLLGLGWVQPLGWAISQANRERAQATGLGTEVSNHLAPWAWLFWPCLLAWLGLCLYSAWEARQAALEIARRENGPWFT